jgi:ketopantoate hydroxymethyltransferase
LILKIQKMTIARDKKLNAIIASDKLGMACFRCVTKNSFSIPNCEYSHDRVIIAAARDKQMADLTETKRQMQAGHQANLKVFDKQGAKAVKLNVPQMRPTHTDATPRLSLLGPS